MKRRPPRSTRTDTLFPTRPSSDLCERRGEKKHQRHGHQGQPRLYRGKYSEPLPDQGLQEQHAVHAQGHARRGNDGAAQGGRSEEHTSELQSLMRISYAVFCLQKKKKTKQPDIIDLTELATQ